MSCQKVQEQIPLVVDQQLAAEEWEQFQAHVSSCRRCDSRLESLRNTRAGLRGMAEPAVPARLTAKLRVIASHERARRVARIDFAARVETWKSDVRLFFDNLMRPFALPVAGGLFSA